MKLSQIKLSGFKSFVESTTIEVKGNRVAIVGPNGCGKSNVIDAVRWVLGESSAKQLRGESMQDVIFNGSTQRKSVSRATVELVFDNSQKGLSGLWNNYNEVAIKRLISRSGESVYYINNQVVRRRDITELFLGTGVGTKGYAVIEQGMISRIIESKPEDLRLYLEEAAGVSKYREKRKESISRLQDTKDNLLRIEDIQFELTKQISSLQIQAQQAKCYQDLHAQLKDTQLTISLLKMSKARDILAQIDEQILKYNNELSGLATQLVGEEEYLSISQLDKNKEEIVLQEITNQFNLLRTQLARLEERNRHNQELKERFNLDSVGLSNQLEEATCQIEELNIQIEDLQEQNQSNTIFIEENQLIKLDLTESFNQIEQKYNSVNDIARSLTDQIVVKQHDLRLLNNTKEHKSNQYSNLIIRQKKLEQELNGLDFNQGYFTLRSHIEEIKSELDDLNQKLSNGKGRLVSHKLNQTQIVDQIRKIDDDQIEITTKINTLTQLLNSVNKASDLHEVIDYSGELKHLHQFLSVNPGYELAVEIALNNILSSVMVKDIVHIKGISKSALAIFLGSNEKAKLTPNSLANFIEIKETDLKNILIILNEFTVVDNFAQAKILLPGLTNTQKIVTLDGHLLTKNYILFNANTTNTHVLEHQNELKELDLLCNELIAKKLLADEELAKVNDEILEISKYVEDTEIAHKEKWQLQHKLELEFIAAEQVYLQNKNHHDRLSKELEVIRGDILHVQDELTEIELSIEMNTNEINEISLRAEDSNIGRLEQETAYNLAKSKLSSIDSQINQKIIDNQLLLQKMNILQKNLAEKNLHIELLKERKQKLESEQQELATEQENNNLSDLSVEISELTTRIAEQANVVEGITNKILGNRDTINLLQQTKEKTQEALSKLRLKEQEQLLFLHNQQEVLNSLDVDEYDAEAVLKNNQYTGQELQTKINDLHHQIEELGLVNLKAIEDLEVAQTKYSELLTQITDLVSGIEQLESAINQIDKETRVLMDDTYSKVCQSFSVYFKTLFGGGTASLNLTDSDILNSGIQIFVQPPGKKNSSIHLLSGGEKALTAVSLIFALFNLNPAPFCLLDEVDAPLDDANTARFCNLVKELADNTQFVYISHNRLTMEMADQLVGVTMQEQGVSTTVSVTLGDAIKNVG